MYLACLLCVGSAAIIVQAQKTPAPDDASRAAAIKLFNSLNDDLKKQAVLPADDKDRYKEIFPTTKRPGLSFAQLTAEQKTIVHEMIQGMTSEYGATRCMQVAKQTGDGGIYVTYYGTPTADGAFAWRVATHHLTLIFAQFGKSDANEFGPILLGGNPVKTLWDEEDAIVVKLYGTLSAEEAKRIQGKGSSGSGAAIDKAAMKIGELSEKPRALARQLLAKRLDVFSSDRRKVFEGIVERDGGLDNMRIAIWGNASKHRAEGGVYHWRIGSDNIVCDWQTAGKEHIHMTLRARPKS